MGKRRRRFQFCIERIQSLRRLFLQPCNSQAVVSPNCHRFVETDPDRLIVRDGRRRTRLRTGMVIPPEIQELLASKDRRIAELEALVAELLRQVGAGQHEQLEAAFERRVEEEAAGAPQSARQVRQDERRPGGPRGRHAAAGRPTRFRGSARACVCRHCRLPLDPKAPIAIEKRQVFDLPERLLLVTEHQASTYRCANCRGVTKAAFPEGVVSPAQYGERFKAAAVYMNVQQLIPEDRTAQTMSASIRRASGLFGERRRLGGREGGRATPVYARIGERVAGEKVRHLDETGYRIGGKLQWLHTTSSLCFTFLSRRRKARRHSQEFERRRRRSRPLQALQRARRGHPRLLQRPFLRELEGLIEFEKEPWAELMRACCARPTRRCARRGTPESGRSRPSRSRPSSSAIGRRSGSAWRIIAGCRRWRRSRRLADAANNVRPQSARQAEEVQNRNAAFPHRLRRALHQQPRRTRSADDEGQDEDLRRLPDPRGRANFALLRSVVSTARKQGLNILQVLTAPPSGSCNLSPSDSRPEPRRSSATRRRVRRDGTPPHRKRRRRAFGTDPETPCRREDTEQQRTPTPTPRTFATSPQQAAPHPIGRRPAVAGPPTHRPPPPLPAWELRNHPNPSPFVEGPSKKTFSCHFNSLQD